MSTTDNSELLAGMAAELTSSPAEREAAAEPDQDDVSRYAEYQARTIAGAEPVPHSDDADDDDDEADVQPDMTGEKRVPLAALHKERQRRQQLQAQLQQLQAAAQQQQEQFRAWAAQVQQQAQLAGQQAPQQPVQPQQLPDFAEDPEGHVKALQAQLQAVQQQQASQQHQQAAAAQEAHVRQAIAANAQAIAAEVEPVEAAYQQENPDWPEAFDFMQRHADEAIMQRYPGMPRQQVELIKTLAIAKLHEDCRRNGTNPCALVHAEAKRLGFKAQARAAQSAGVPRLDGLSLEQIASMDDDQFNQLFDSMKRGGYAAPRV